MHFLRFDGILLLYHKQLGYEPAYFSESDVSKDGVLMSIILEEASAYFSGVRNIDDTVKFITDRVNTRIHE